MANIKDEMDKKREKQREKQRELIRAMSGHNEQNKSNPDAEINTTPSESVEPEQESEDVKMEQVAKADQEQPVKETKETKEEKPKKKDKKPYEGVLTYKQVPDENKTVRKNIVLYPSLCKEIERIVNLEKKKGNKKFTFNDLVNQVLIEYANEYNKQ